MAKELEEAQKKKDEHEKKRKQQEEIDKKERMTRSQYVIEAGKLPKSMTPKVFNRSKDI